MTESDSVQFLKGVGEKRAAALQKLGIVTVEDLLCHYPRQYEDWTQIIPVREAAYGETCCLKLRLTALPVHRVIRKGMELYTFTAGDGTGLVKITLFNNPYLANSLTTDRDYLFYGTVSGTFTRPELSSPMIVPAETGMRIRPIYAQTAGINSRYLEKEIATALHNIEKQLDDDILPPALRHEHALCTHRYAVQNIHFPADRAALEIARRRLVFEELFLLQLGLLRLKGHNQTTTGIIFPNDYTADFRAVLPYTLTGAQQRAVNDCLADMRRPSPMNRLLQGDVGSGKTAVAACLAFNAIRNGYQCVMMAPTEILAQQHATSLQNLFSSFPDIQVELLTGSMTKSQKHRVLSSVADGTCHFLIGTHAVLSEQVEFSALGLVITDEQHRFGVRQRAALAAKGQHPHMLVMSATPIPRTLALMLYGDLEISVLDELPPGRTPIKTYAIDTEKRERALGYVRRFLDEGRQAYIVCPLVEEGETAALKDAVSYAEELKRGALRGYTVGVLHGKMKPKEKEAVMRDFAENRLAVLVSTTVVEVGVDVPNAVLMVIENAERFGLAQLHQLRGRVGRGKHASTCILISDAQNADALRRLKVMCETTDGFRIADEDLKLRGPGDFFGDRQHGLPQLRIADFINDMAVLREAQAAAVALRRTDPSLSRPEHHLLRLAVEALFNRRDEQSFN